jgi:hypothetical protein
MFGKLMDDCAAITSSEILGPIKINAANRTDGNRPASFRAPQSLLCQRFDALQKNLQRVNTFNFV